MRVILKPVGILCILVAFAILAWVTIWQRRKIEEQTNREVPVPVTQVVPITAQIVNGGFEDDYVLAQPYATVGKVSGLIAAPWHDDSSWAPVTIVYTQESAHPHGGKSCQKVAITEVAAGAEARAQFVQELQLPMNKPQRAVCWIRADRATEIDFALRQKGAPYRYYGVNKVSVGTSWQKIEVTGTPNALGSSFVMLKVSKPVTFWLDDASIAEDH